jgi:hypothetical protein
MKTYEESIKIARVGSRKSTRCALTTGDNTPRTSLSRLRDAAALDFSNRRFESSFKTDALAPRPLAPSRSWRGSLQKLGIALQIHAGTWWRHPPLLRERHVDAFEEETAPDASRRRRAFAILSSRRN